MTRYKPSKGISVDQAGAVMRMYHAEYMSTTEIANVFGCSQAHVCNFMRRNAIVARSLTDANRISANKTAEVRSEKMKGKPSWALGKTWTRALPDNERQRLSENFLGSKNPMWKGGVMKDAEHQRQVRRDHKAKRRGKNNKCMPSWVDKAAIAKLYREAKKSGLSVDHIVPLSSKIVCGLHCVANLRLIPLAENLKKSNTTWPDMP